jgi:DNA-binding beta-propeller fold protein YncE
MRVGEGDFRYEVAEGWGKVPEYFELSDPVDVAVDSRDRLYVGSRGNHPVLIFDRDGGFVSCWGEGRFDDPHGVTIGSDDSVYITDRAANTVEKCTPSGSCLMRLGARYKSSPIFERKPFNQPTDLALGAAGETYVCDGYGNFLVHKFSPQGTRLATWGGYGSAPGQFLLPHRVGVDRRERVYVVDRNNDRIQVFSPEGEFVSGWGEFGWPQDLHIDRTHDLFYVVETQRQGSKIPRLTIRDAEARVLCWWDDRRAEGGKILDNPHSICVDSRGDIYVGEVARTRRIQKFVRVH